MLLVTSGRFQNKWLSWTKSENQVCAHLSRCKRCCNPHLHQCGLFKLGFTFFLCLTKFCFLTARRLKNISIIKSCKKFAIFVRLFRIVDVFLRSLWWHSPKTISRSRLIYLKIRSSISHIHCKNWRLDRCVNFFSLNKIYRNVFNITKYFKIV